VQKSGQRGVVVQAVRIQTPQTRVEHTVYRDAEGRRHPKAKAIPGNEVALANTLAAAGVSWDDPLSPGSFDFWHNHAKVQQDIVKRTRDGLLTLTTTVADNNVASESLIVRATDFHTVGKSIQLRGQGLIEIAEVSYGVVPWNSISPDIFEPLDTAAAPSERHLQPETTSHLPREVSSGELDVAELSARLVLNRLALDDNGRIEIIRGIDGVHVHGIVETEAQKEQLQAQLRMVPHVLPSILTVQEMTEHSTPDSTITSIHQSSGAAEAPSSLEHYFTEHRLDHQELAPTAQQIVESSFVVKHEVEQVAFLLQRFSTNNSLPSEARTDLGELLVQHKTALLAALGREERALTAVQLLEHPSGTSAGADDVQSLRSDAETNRTLCVELTSTNVSSPRSAQAIVPQLQYSIAQLRAAALQISTTPSSHLPSPGTTGLANKNE